MRGQKHLAQYKINVFFIIRLRSNTHYITPRGTGYELYNIQNFIIIAMKLYNIVNVGEKPRLYAQLLLKGRNLIYLYPKQTFPALVRTMA